jgi:hydroxymethylpyrimidine kinase/phosphomethylpyrimidine kinase
MISKHGHALMTEPARRALAEQLLPRAYLVTPNLPEAAELAGTSVHDIESMERAAEKIISLGARGALIKGGHLEGDAADLLRFDNETVLLTSPRIETRHTHGTGCTYSACIAAELAKGSSIKDAAAAAKEFITRAIADAPGLGQGYGPVNHFVR